jgi:D-methionine transport system ATP-binding protein
MVFPNHANVKDMRNKHCCRIAFDGQSSFEPVIAGMILEFKQPVNIIFANTQNIGGKAFGQIVLQMPEDEHIAAKMEQYLQIKGLSVEAFEADDTLEVRG